MANYDSVEITTVGGKSNDFPSDLYELEHTKKFGEPVLKVTQIALPPTYGERKIRPTPKDKQRVIYFLLSNVVSISYRYYG